MTKRKILLIFFKGLLRMNSAEIMADLSTHTPMMQQYLKVKKKTINMRCCFIVWATFMNSSLKMPI